MPHHTRLLRDLQKWFPKVETVSGWETRGSASFAPAIVVCHWTAGPRASTKRPSLNVVLNGRPGLSGPLAQVYLDRDGIPVLLAAGRANHAGPGNWRGVTGNSGALGIEAEAADGDDWTPAQRKAYPRLVAAMLQGLGRGAEFACGHSEFALPKGRKIDVNGWPMDAMRAEVAALLKNPNATTNEEDELTPAEKEMLTNVNKAVGIIYDLLTPGQEGVKYDGDLYRMIRDTPYNTWLFGIGGINGYDADGKPTYGDVPAWQRLANLDGKTDAQALLGLMRSATAPQVDVKALAAALAPTITSALKAAPAGASAEATAKAVADELARRMATPKAA